MKIESFKNLILNSKLSIDMWLGNKTKIYELLIYYIDNTNSHSNVLVKNNSNFFQIKFELRSFLTFIYTPSTLAKIQFSFFKLFFLLNLIFSIFP